MVQPINYLGMMPQIDLGRSLAEGLAMRENIKAARADRELVRQKVEAARAAREQQEQWAQAAQEAMQSPTAEAFARLHLINPDASTSIKEAWGALDKQRQDTELREMAALGGLLRAGRPEMARERLQARIEADKAAGQNTAQDEQILALIDQDPKAARFMVDYALSSIAGPEKFGQLLGELGEEARAQELQPSAVRKAEADATKAAVDAKYAEPKAQLDMANTRSEMSAREVQSEVARGNLEVARGQLRLGRDRLSLDREKAAAEGAKQKDFTEAQTKDAFNAKRMARATGIIAGIEPSTYGERLKLAAAPFSAQRKKYDAAKMEWADAMLRLTSGAEAPEPEVRRTAETYFPTGTDSSEVIQQKAEMRRQIMRDAIMRAGDAAAGLVMDGYRYKGGDPAQQASWEKVS